MVIEGRVNFFEEGLANHRTASFAVDSILIPIAMDGLSCYVGTSVI